MVSLSIEYRIGFEVDGDCDWKRAIGGFVKLTVGLRRWYSMVVWAIHGLID
jgi:hypothetical protein